MTITNWGIIFDPGHGVTTIGKRSPDGQYREYKMARELAKLCMSYASSCGLQSWLTVEDDTDLGLSKRASKANSIMSGFKSAGSGRHTLFISLHSNAGPGSSNVWKSYRGWSVYTTNGQNNSDKLATCIYNSVRDEVSEKWGVKMRQDLSDGDSDFEADFTVIYKANMPAVLCENLFHDNKEDVILLQTQDFLTDLAKAIVDGTISYIENTEN